MIISCPSCKKKFEIDTNLIPKEGRNLQCGSCSNIWFYKVKQSISNLENIDNIKDVNEEDGKNEIKEKFSDIKKENSENIKDKALIKYEKKTKLTFVNLMGYFIVLIISFVALLIVLNTLQPLLLKIFPNLELILFNFYETLLDIYLFTKDLIR